MKYNECIFNLENNGCFTIEFFELSMDHKVGIVKGGAFAAEGVPYGQSFRLSFTYPSKEDIEKGIKILGELTKQACD